MIISLQIQMGTLYLGIIQDNSACLSCLVLRNLAAKNTIAMPRLVVRSVRLEWEELVIWVG